MTSDLNPGREQDTGEYGKLLELEALESLLEELEEEGVSGMAAHETVPGDLRERMGELGVRNVQEIRDRIMYLHAEIDQDDNELTISDS